MSTLAHPSGRAFFAFIVDDNKVMRDLVRRMLQDIGVRSSDFRGGEQALAALATSSPDLIFVDFRMSPMDGIGFTRALRAGSAWMQTVPVIMITGHAEPSVIAAAREAGVTEFLAKPISPAVLRVRTEHILLGRPHGPSIDFTPGT